MDENLLIWAGIAIGAYLLYQSAQSSAASSSSSSTSAPAPTLSPSQQSWLNVLSQAGITLSASQLAQLAAGNGTFALTPSQANQLTAYNVAHANLVDPNPTPASSASVGTPPVAPVGVSGIYPWERY